MRIGDLINGEGFEKTPFASRGVELPLLASIRTSLVSGHRHTLSQSRCTCGRICSQESSRSSFRISSGFGSARNRCNRSASRAQASAGPGSASTCCRVAFPVAATTAGSTLTLSSKRSTCDRRRAHVSSFSNLTIWSGAGSARSRARRCSSLLHASDGSTASAGCGDRFGDAGSIAFAFATGGGRDAGSGSIFFRGR